MQSKAIWLQAVLASSMGLAGACAHADVTYQFAPYTVTAPDSRSFANSTVGSPGTLATGALTYDANNVLVYNFLDKWDFELNPGANLIAFVGSINFTNGANQVTFGIDNLQINLLQLNAGAPSSVVKGWTTAIAGPGFQQIFSIVAQTPFQAGTYELQVRGLLTGAQSSYAGTLQAIDSVPLPPALHFMAAGLALLGWRARRQRTDR